MKPVNQRQIHAELTAYQLYSASLEMEAIMRGHPEVLLDIRDLLQEAAARLGLTIVAIQNMEASHG